MQHLSTSDQAQQGASGSGVGPVDDLPAVGQKHRPALQASKLTGSGRPMQQVQSVTAEEFEQMLRSGEVSIAQTPAKPPRSARRGLRSAPASRRTASRHAAAHPRQLQQTGLPSGEVTPDHVAMASGLFHSRASLSSRQSGGGHRQKAAQHSPPTRHASMGASLATPDPAEWSSAQPYLLPDDSPAAVGQAAMQDRVPDSIDASIGGEPWGQASRVSDNVNAGLEGEPWGPASRAPDSAGVSVGGGVAQQAADIQPGKAHRGGVRQQPAVSARKRKSCLHEATGNDMATGD